jgi:3-hydroxyisobutyrate dehydrogenase-like beta-hydroxyacid dehydrogenase
MTAIGFVGLGGMGSRIAGRLLEAGHTVYGTNRTRSKAGALIDQGLIWRDSPREVSTDAEVVFSMVTDTAALQAITEGPDGILPGLRPGSVYIDMSTVSPEASAAIAEHVGELGAAMLDAPVSGSVPAAAEGSLAIMVGGDLTAFARVEPLLRELGQTVTHVGENGKALMMKLALNISLAVQMIAFSEGVLLAEQGGVDPKVAIEVLTTSPLGSPMLQLRGPIMLDRPGEAWFDVDLMQKDIGLVLEQGRTLAVPLPTASIANWLLTAARALGYGDRDIVAVFDVLERFAGRQPVAA